ncbi:COG4223 family protein [Afipia sp. P52-10]|uniref:COG4223 family protein n=1 Tax=Afipia sp. P52-10 TaxID=1429916 RepID=UPI0004B86A04|nr:hypothetical protein [Afipia sp. P52-10]
MANERQDDPGASPVEQTPKRAPPTIDLAATDVSGDASAQPNESGTDDHADAEQASAPQPGGETPGGQGRGSVRTILAAVSGAVASLAVIAAAWFGGVVGPSQPAAPAISSAQFDKVAAEVGALTSRLSHIEANAAKPAAPAQDAALLSRAAALEKDVGAVRDDLAALKTQAASTASALNDLKTAPAASERASVNLAPLTERLARLEQTAQSLSAELAARKTQAGGDINVRRLVVANALETAVLRGVPYTEALNTAKQVAIDASVLAPLDAFAAKGVPSDTAYLREIVQILRQLTAGGEAKAVATNAADKPATGEGVLGRLQSSLSKLVRVERTDAPAAQGASQPLVASLEASARRDDFAAVRRDLAKLPQADDPQVQAWIRSVDARDAALAAARQFSAQALSAVGKSGG